MRVRWGPIIPLKRAFRENLIYLPERAKLPPEPGVYVFGRRRKSGDFEALYIGRANNIRDRVWGHRKNLPLMMHLWNAKQGEKVVRAGVFKRGPRQNIEKCLALIERGLIRHFMSEGHDLANQQGTRIRRHEILTDGKHPKQFVPREIFVDRGREE